MTFFLGEQHLSVTAKTLSAIYKSIIKRSWELEEENNEPQPGEMLRHLETPWDTLGQLPVSDDKTVNTAADSSNILASLGLHHFSLMLSRLTSNSSLRWCFIIDTLPAMFLWCLPCNSLTHSICFDQTSQHQPMRGWDSRHRPITALDYSEQSSRVECSKTLVLLLSLCVWEQASSSSNLACGCAGWAHIWTATTLLTKSPIVHELKL